MSAVAALESELQAAGYKPVLLLGKATKKSHVVKVFTPRCTLATFAEESLKKMGSIHEYICQGWTPFASGTAEGPEEGRGTTQMDMDMGEVEDRAVQVEEGEEVALQVEEGEEVALQLEEVALQLEEVALQVEEVALQVEEVALQMEEGALQVEEGALQVEEGALQVEEGALQVEEVAHPDTEGPAVSTVQRSKEHHSQKGLEKRNKTLPKNCPYHIGRDSFEIRSYGKERMRKGIKEVLVDWQPCPVCGKEWARSWQPKDLN
ncbi:unnamed protein product [Arctogadus glacialis]